MNNAKRRRVLKGVVWTEYLGVGKMKLSDVTEQEQPQRGKMCQKMVPLKASEERS